MFHLTYSPSTTYKLLKQLCYINKSSFVSLNLQSFNNLQIYVTLTN
nr:MAG TPA: hypothetical protein [Caudoviricetes sp.]